MLIDLKVGESLGIATNPDTRHFPGVVVDKRSFNHSVGRGRRSPACRTGEYLHPNETHCCVKCHPGMTRCKIFLLLSSVSNPISQHVHMFRVYTEMLTLEEIH